MRNSFNKQNCSRILTLTILSSLSVPRRLWTIVYYSTSTVIILLHYCYREPRPTSQFETARTSIEQSISWSSLVAAHGNRLQQSWIVFLFFRRTEARKIKSSVKPWIMCFLPQCFTISTSEVGIIERWGRYDRLAKAGCHIICPPMDVLVGTLSFRVQELNVRVESKTL